VRNFARLAGPFILGFFLAGIGWGVWSHKQQIRKMAQAAPLRVLCAENWLSESTLHAFSRENNVPVQLWTYARPSEFLRQMANTDGKVDVICTSSLLLKSLIQSHWILKTDYSTVPNLQQVSVDFQNLPFDAHREYSVPLFWNLYGFFGKAQAAPAMTWKQVWSGKKVALWGEELVLLDVMSRLGVNVEQKLESEEVKSLEDDIRHFTTQAADIFKPDTPDITADALTAKGEWILLPLGRVARWLGEDSPYKFWLPEDGAAMEIGLLSIGSRSEQAGLAKKLIDMLLSTEHAEDVHRRLGAGVVHVTLNNAATVAPAQRAEAVRAYPLNRFRFPDVNVEALPRFQKIYDETLAKESNGKK
jgi:spermidine/putrescine-binding protein